jgi:hypothetical protein
METQRLGLQWAMPLTRWTVMVDRKYVGVVALDAGRVGAVRELGGEARIILTVRKVGDKGP